jgi:hemerythrin-like domain-containing protein
MTKQVPESERELLPGPGLIDVRMMLVAHTNFRRELGLSPAAVRRVADGDRPRVALVADHVTLFLDLLHHHHSIEDELLWGALLARVPDELAPLVRLMESQHEYVSALLAESHAAIAVWRGTGTSADGTRLAGVLERLTTALFEHLHAEETHLLPVMARHITAAEWGAFTEAGMSSIPKRLMFLGFGMMLYEGDADAIAIELGKVPAPVRLLLPPLGRRAYRRYARSIHGTATPAKGVGAASSLNQLPANTEES